MNSIFANEPSLAVLVILLAIFLALFMAMVICALCGITLEDTVDKICTWDASKETPKKLKPLVKAKTNRDFVIKMLKLRKETIDKCGYDPTCPKNATEEEQLIAEELADTLEYLVNKYPDPDEFDKAFTKFLNNNKEN